MNQHAINSTCVDFDWTANMYIRCTAVMDVECVSLGKYTAVYIYRAARNVFIYCCSVFVAFTVLLLVWAGIGKIVVSAG